VSDALSDLPGSLVVTSPDEGAAFTTRTVLLGPGRAASTSRP
jgi:hypothetical protein